MTNVSSALIPLQRTHKTTTKTTAKTHRKRPFWTLHYTTHQAYKNTHLRAAQKGSFWTLKFHGSIKYVRRHTKCHRTHESKHLADKSPLFLCPYIKVHPIQAHTSVYERVLSAYEYACAHARSILLKPTKCYLKNYLKKGVQTPLKR